MKRGWIVILLVFQLFAARAEDVKKITLEEAILLARTNSVDAAVAINELRSAYWEYRSYKANLLPEVNFTATLPSYNKSYSAYQQSDGSYTFVRNNNIGLNGELSITQNIWFTGGTLSINSSLDFLRQIDGNVGNRYMSVPVALTLNQPIFGVNTVKWDRKIEPLRYAEAKAQFISDTEEVTLLTIQYFFNLLEAKERVNTARLNLSNAEKLYEVAQAKRKMGQISENDLLQIELNTLTARSSLTSYESTMKNAMFQLRSFLDVEENTILEPQIPDEVPLTVVNYDMALAKALDNNAHAKNIQRRQLEADYAVAKAKGNLRQVNLFAQIGYTGTNNTLKDSYRGLKDNQVIEVGVSIPLLDWGKRRGQVKVAQSNREVIQSKLKKEIIDFNQNLFILVERFNNQREQLEIAKRTDEIAQRRYDTNVHTFMIGKISTLDLNDSQENKDSARQEHINAIFYYWYYYYQLRSLTLWDFEKNCSIDADFEKIVRN